ncbi:CAP domain-containing protein [Legionella shakespearei]|uniref:Putative transporter n=1 Tax=Legionella shakespearei DSM 23087 TaxID=1122169 RepID=A0A0W0Z0Y3_9GAMM|nr:CAP domain-containing protein [Legionella shakespearei]KTD62804.1 putative transporter [Legionella shakespearei DSM 23087]
MYSNKIKNAFVLLFFLITFFQSAYAQKQAVSKRSDTAIQNAILVHINEYRQKRGLAPLKMDERIVREAKNHSIDMANHTMPFGHKYFKSRIDRLHAQIKNSNAGAENVAYNYKDAQDVVRNWLRSPGHKRNIDGNYNLTGIGIARDQKGKIYFTQIFLKTGAATKHVARRNVSLPFGMSLFKRQA